jgi:plasmid stabilization system protein ParE
MTYRVVFSPEALAQLEALFRYIAQAAGPVVADRYTNAIVTYCEGLHVFPLRGMRRNNWGQIPIIFAGGDAFVGAASSPRRVAGGVKV